MKVFYSEAHLLHAPAFEIFDGGEKLPNFEVPERALRIMAALELTGWADIQPPEDFGLSPILAVHDAGYLDFLRTAYSEWLGSGIDAEYEKSALLPATFPAGGWRRVPKSLLGKAGFYMSDLSAPITAGTWEAALGSSNCALSGAKAILAGERASFALCRPPGHHAGRNSCGGYCYINNAAVSANWLSKETKTAILDIDYHAGNGTQDIFYERGDVLTISIHADPDYEYPYFAGYADEHGSGMGLGFHHNFPLPAGTGTNTYLETLGKALKLIQNFGTQSLVVSAGMDIFQGDPLGKFAITKSGISRIGLEIARLNLPTLIMMEGGYNNAALGENIVTLLEAWR
jgi:acetoin utilization deacetylase AcuC-like enzyme